VIATAWWALARPTDTGAAWLQGLYGVWLFIAPWPLDFAGQSAPAWNSWSVGVGVAVLAGWVMAEQAPIRSMRANSVPDHMTHGSH